MTTSKTITIQGVGEVLLERSARARNINISIRPSRGIRVAVPGGVSFEHAEKVARSKAGWMQKHLSRMEEASGNEDKPVRDPDFLINPMLRKIAERMIVERLGELAEKYNFTYNKVTIRNQKTRWGSCSAQNNISLNIKLVMLPTDLMEYVLLHELVHTRVKNHSPAFWEELGKCIPDPRGVDRKLNRYRIGLL